MTVQCQACQRTFVRKMSHNCLSGFTKRRINWRPNEMEKPIWQVALDISASLTAEDTKDLPKDLAKNYKHYLYGTPKQEEE